VFQGRQVRKNTVRVLFAIFPFLRELILPTGNSVYKNQTAEKNDRMCRNQIKSVELKLKRLQKELQSAQQKNHIQQQKFAALRNTLQLLELESVFKIAKLLQILKNPQCAGNNSRSEVIKKIFRNIFFREPFYPEYSLFETVWDHINSPSPSVSDKVADDFPEQETLFQWDSSREEEIRRIDALIFSTLEETELDLLTFDCNTTQYSMDLTLSEERPSILLCRGRDIEKIPRSHLKKFHSIYAFFDGDEAGCAGKNAEKIRSYNIFCFAPPQTVTGQWLDAFTSRSLRCDIEDFGKAALLEYCGQLSAPGNEMADSSPVRDGKIIILAEKLSSGGMEQVIFDMFTQFKRMGRDCLLAVFSRPGKDCILPPGITPVVLDGKSPRTALKELFDRFHCSAVIAHYCTKGAQSAYEAGIPFLQVIHNCYVWFTAKELYEYASADRFTTAYISVSAAAAWYAMERINLPPRKMFIIENTIDADKFIPDKHRRTELRDTYKFKETDFVLVNPASCTPSKGQLNLLHAFAGAFKKHPRLRLILAGKIQDKQYYSKLQQIISSNALENVVMHGNYFEKMSDIYNMSDGVVFSSFWEGCSLAAAEAIQMELPVVSPRCGDIERQTEEKNCVLFDLPFSLTELNSTNCYKMLHFPDQEIIKNLQESICRLVEGNYPSAKTPSVPLSIQETFCKYLQIIEAVTKKIS